VLPDRFNAFPAKLLAIRVGREIDDSQIDAKCPRGLDRPGSVVRQLDVEKVEAVPTLDQNGGGRLAALQERLPSVSKSGGDLDPARQQGQSERPVPLDEREDPGIVVNRRRSEG
jgi:hypothetical protein